MKYGTVTKLVEKPYESYRDPGQTKIAYSIQIVSVDNDWHNKWVLQGQKSKKTGRHGVITLGDLSKVLVVQANQVPDEAREVLDKEMFERGEL